MFALSCLFAWSVLKCLLSLPLADGRRRRKRRLCRVGCCEAGGQDGKMLSQKQRINAPELARPLLPTRTDGLCPGWGREAGTKPSCPSQHRLPCPHPAAQSCCPSDAACPGTLQDPGKGRKGAGTTAPNHLWAAHLWLLLGGDTFLMSEKPLKAKPRACVDNVGVGGRAGPVAVPCVPGQPLCSRGSRQGAGC